MNKITLILLAFFASITTFAQTGGYCLPTYNTVCNSPSTNDLIDNFSTTGGITNISNLNSGCNFGPSNYQNVGQVVTTSPGSIINFSVQCGAIYAQGFAIWIDWNQDLDFTDPGEKIYESPSSGFQVFTGSFTVPQTLLCGDYRIRVRSEYATGGANIDPCDNQTYGETEDYTLTVTNCSSQEQTICEGETAIIDYTTLLPGLTGLSVTVSPMTDVSIAIPILSFFPLDTTIYLVTWTNPDSSWQDTVKIYVNDPLLPTYAGLDDSVCDGNIVNLQGTLGNTNTNYQWNVGYPGVNIGANYFPSNTTLNTNMLNGSPGTAYAILVESDTSNICPSVSDTAVIIFSEEFHTITKADPTCNGYDDGQIVINSFGTLGATEYSIDNGGTWSTSNTFTGLLAGTYDVISRDIIGCSFASTISLIDPDEITISTVNDTTVCENGTATLIGTSTNGQYFNWNFTPGLSANQAINPTTDSTITVYATNIAGCSSDTLTIEVTMYDPISISITENDTICPGNPTSVVVTATGGHLGFDYAWLANGSATNWATSVLNLNPNEATQYCVTVTDGCESTPKSLCTNVKMRPVPTTNFTTTILEKCVPAVAEFEIVTPDYLFETAKISVDGKQYIINNSGNGDAVITHTFYNVGTFDFYLKVTSPYGCINDTTAYQEVTSYPIPEPAFYLTPDEATIFQPIFSTVNLTQGANNSYSWLVPGGDPASSVAENLVIHYPEGEPGEYPISLAVESDQGCRDTITNYAIVINDIVIYAPNTFTPNDDNYNDVWRVFIEGIDVYEFHLQVFNRWGEKVFESFDPNSEWDGRMANGTLVDPGTFVWLIKATDISSSEVFDYRGTINVLK